MIVAAPPPAAAAPAPIAFAPPIGRPLRYVAVDRQPSDKGTTTVTLTQTLRFDRDAAGALTATATLLDATVDARPRARAAIEALEAPLVGVPVAIRLAANGAPGDVIDPERSWIPVEQSLAALERKAAEPGMASPAELALLRAMVAAQRPRSSAERDARLRDGVAQLLSPPLPALLPGEARAFASEIATPGGTVPAHGTTLLVAGTSDRIVYRTTLATDRAAGAAAAASLRASVTASMPGAERTRIEALADAMAAAAFTEVVELEVEPRTGLLLRLHSRRSADDGHGEPRLIAERTVELKRQVS